MKSQALFDSFSEKRFIDGLERKFKADIILLFIRIASKKSPPVNKKWGRFLSPDE